MYSQDRRATVVRHSYDSCTNVEKFSHCRFFKLSLRHVRYIRTNAVRLSPDNRTYLGEKNAHKNLNMFETFATTSRLVRDT